jgi:hypothetical protein
MDKLEDSDLDSPALTRCFSRALSAYGTLSGTTADSENPRSTDLDACRVASTNVFFHHVL